MNYETSLQQYLTGHDTSVLEERLGLKPDLGFNYEIHSDESLSFLKSPSLQSVKSITSTKTDCVTEYYINIFKTGNGYIAFIGETDPRYKSNPITRIYDANNYNTLIKEIYYLVYK